MKLSSHTHSLYEDSVSYKFKFHLPLSRSKKRYNLFIGNDSDNNLLNKNEADSTPEIGINYFALERYGITSKYSVGLSGLSPLVSARYYGEYNVGNWIVEPVQTFRYLLEDEFREESYLYFSTQTKESNLYRIILFRSSETHIKGMNYRLSLMYYLMLNKKSIFQISQSFFGNTTYEFIDKDSTSHLDTTTKNGLYSYITTINFKQNIWKDWFYYEIGPAISFNNDRLYKANYSIFFSIDMYFGNYQNHAY